MTNHVEPDRPWCHNPPFIYDEGVDFEKYLIDNNMKVLVSKVTGGYHQAELLGSYYHSGTEKFRGTARLPEIAINDLKRAMSLCDYSVVIERWYHRWIENKKFPYFK